MHILVTNDDGVQAPGLLALAQELRTLARVTVFAPDRNWSASGHVKTLDRPLRVREEVLADGSPALSTDGAPSDSVALALLGVVQEKVDLVVSGINPRENIGHDVTYSGTVTAAMEAVIGGVPGMAVSLHAPEDFHGTLDYSTAAQVGRRVAARLLAEGLPIEEYAQSDANMTRAAQRVFDAVAEERIHHGGDPELTDYVLNTAVKTGRQGGFRFTKPDDEARIDGAIALAMALDVAEAEGQEGGGIGVSVG